MINNSNNFTMGNKFMGSVKVGLKGQIVIPKEVREMFKINQGDTLILLADPEKGIAIQNFEKYNAIFDKAFPPKDVEEE